jgi:hypothetical protein
MRFDGNPAGVDDENSTGPSARSLGNNVTITFPDRPQPGEDWRAMEGYGWIFKAWFSDSVAARTARSAIQSEGWMPERRRWGRKVRVPVRDGFDGERLVRFVASKWPETRMQLRSD